MTTRPVAQVFRSRPTIEGAGVHLRRAFGNAEVPRFDPFLLLDDFRSHEPSHYLPGFPWHPHRGIETITYVLGGRVEHGDSLGNRGVIASGDVQWMTAGSGIVHQEMPQGDPDGTMLGFQLWANLPAAHKMTAPRYRDVVADEIPIVRQDGGAEVRVICGRVDAARGPVRDVVIEPEYLDVRVPPATTWSHPIRRGHTAFAYVIEGQGRFDAADRPRDGTSPLADGWLALFGDGDQVTISADEQPVRFLLVSGKPLGEPVAWFGPIVMNTQDELRLAFEEYRNGSFLKHQAG